MKTNSPVGKGRIYVAYDALHGGVVSRVRSGTPQLCTPTKGEASRSARQLCSLQHKHINHIICISCAALCGRSPTTPTALGPRAQEARRAPKVASVGCKGGSTPIGDRSSNYHVRCASPESHLPSACEATARNDKLHASNMRPESTSLARARRRIAIAGRWHRHSSRSSVSRCSSEGGRSRAP